ncbi:hypothetical protein ACFW2V_12180 [Streptomyces sp. NPDC058947]|uniref:hypothetical protein n=1 Tax=Streptomyces sp. NPDC058947 TaxID=3346675 RepID=UPI00368FE71F
MERNLTTVNGSIEFRDAAMKLAREGREVYASLTGSRGAGKTYRILTSPTSHITLEDLFVADHPPVLMEDFATALVIADKTGHVPSVEVFTL